MNKLRFLSVLAIAAMMFTVQSCSDDTVDPTTGGGGTSSKNCKIASTVDDDDYKQMFIFDGDRLVKIETDDAGSKFTVNYNYIDGKLVEIVEGSYTYKIAYDGSGNVDRIDEMYDGELEGYYNVTVNGSGKPTSIDMYIRMEDMTDVLTANYAYTWDGDNVSKLEYLVDATDDGELSKDVDYLIEIAVNQYDDKTNPMYGLPTFWSDFFDFESLSKNNMTKGTLTDDGDAETLTRTITYDENNLPKTATSVDGSDSYTTTYTYTCE